MLFAIDSVCARCFTYMAATEHSCDFSNSFWHPVAACDPTVTIGARRVEPVPFAIERLDLFTSTADIPGCFTLTNDQRWFLHLVLYLWGYCTE